jgi:type IV pilus assembly protein PilB
MLGLNKLGFYPEIQAQFENIVEKPYGMILVTGPTGSGKSTTLYSVLNKLNRIEVNICTIEDPVEYQLPGINQVQTNEKAGLTFANALRAFLRQDPDIIMVGEIRDTETARIAVEAALTGHLVLSTLHTNDAAGAITRLVEMGIEPFLCASAIIGVQGQRLCRTICPNCRESYVPPPESVRRFGLTAYTDSDITFYRGRGCDHCKMTGYKGRIGIQELLIVTDRIRGLILQRASTAEIRQAAIEEGMKTMQDDGLRKVLDGSTTIEECLRVVYIEGQDF